MDRKKRKKRLDRIYRNESFMSNLRHQKEVDRYKNRYVIWEFVFRGGDIVKLKFKKIKDVTCTVKQEAHAQAVIDSEHKLLDHPDALQAKEYLQKEEAGTVTDDEIKKYAIKRRAYIVLQQIKKGREPRGV